MNKIFYKKTLFISKILQMNNRCIKSFFFSVDIFAEMTIFSFTYVDMTIKINSISQTYMVVCFHNEWEYGMWNGIYRNNIVWYIHRQKETESLQSANNVRIERCEGIHIYTVRIYILFFRLASSFMLTFTGFSDDECLTFIHFERLIC